MARVTVEDCVDKVKDRFELVAVAAQRARNIASGAAITIDRNNEKNTVISLREIGDETVEVDALREDLVRNYQLQRDMDEDVREVLEVSADELVEVDVPETDDASKEATLAEEGELIEEGYEEEEITNDDEGDYSFEDENVDVDD